MPTLCRLLTVSCFALIAVAFNGCGYRDELVLALRGYRGNLYRR
jgi:hypothetical protein